MGGLLFLVLMGGIATVVVVLGRVLPAGVRDQMHAGWRPWVWVPGLVASALYVAAMVTTWAGAIRGDGVCWSMREHAAQVDVDIELKGLPPFVTCVWEDGVRRDLQ